MATCKKEWETTCNFPIGPAAFQRILSFGSSRYQFYINRNKERNGHVSYAFFKIDREGGQKVRARINSTIAHKITESLEEQIIDAFASAESTRSTRIKEDDSWHAKHRAEMEEA